MLRSQRHLRRRSMRARPPGVTRHATAVISTASTRFSGTPQTSRRYSSALSSCACRGRELLKRCCLAREGERRATEGTGLADAAAGTSAWELGRRGGACQDNAGRRSSFSRPLLTPVGVRLIKKQLCALSLAVAKSVPAQDAACTALAVILQGPKSSVQSQRQRKTKGRLQTRLQQDSVLRKVRLTVQGSG